MNIVHMTIILFILLAISIAGLILTKYILKRNDEVLLFRIALVRIVMLFINKQYKKGFIWRYDDIYSQIPSYARMMYSFKDLKIKKWLPPFLYDRMNAEVKNEILWISIK